MALQNPVRIQFSGSSQYLTAVWSIIRSCSARCGIIIVCSPPRHAYGASNVSAVLPSLREMLASLMRPIGFEKAGTSKAAFRTGNTQTTCANVTRCPGETGVPSADVDIDTRCMATLTRNIPILHQPSAGAMTNGILVAFDYGRRRAGVVTW